MSDYYFRDEMLTGTRFGPDSLIVKNFLQDRMGVDVEELFCQLQEEADWQPRKASYLFYRGRPIARVKFFLCATAEDPNGIGQLRVMYKYNYSGAQWELLLHYRALTSFPRIDDLVQQLNNELRRGWRADEQIGFNHVIGTRYEKAEDNIGFHNDKTKDIQPDTPIVMLSLGGRRELQIARGMEGEKEWKARDMESFIMEPGMLVILGPKTNQLYKHRVAKAEEETLLDRSAEPVQERISLVLRNICTKVTLKQVKQKTAKKFRQNGLPLPVDYQHRADDAVPVRPGAPVVKAPRKAKAKRSGRQPY